MVLGQMLAVLGGILLVSVIPLYLAVNLLGGTASFLDVIGAVILLAIVNALLGFIPVIGWILAVFTPIIVYAGMFDLGVFRATAAYLLQFVILAALIYAALMVGVLDQSILSASPDAMPVPAAS